MISEILYFVVVWHVVASIHSMYVHRVVGHGYITLHPLVEELFVFVLWAVLGSVVSHWRVGYTATHYYHHKYSDSLKDPHSPYYLSFSELCNSGNTFILSEKDINRYKFLDYCTWGEQHIYWKYPKLGQLLFLVISTFLFGVGGFITGIIYLIWTDAIVTLVGKWIIHKVGVTPAHSHPTDRSKNVMPISFFLGGEELHGNHHNDTTLCNFAHKWYEFDIGWFYLHVLIMLRLAKLRVPFLKD